MAISGKELGQQRAFPSSRVEEQVSAKVAYQEGVTKREIFAAFALMGMELRDDGKYSLEDRNRGSDQSHAKWVANAAVRYADALCEALAKDGAA